MLCVLSQLTVWSRKWDHSFTLWHLSLSLVNMYTRLKVWFQLILTKTDLRSTHHLLLEEDLDAGTAWLPLTSIPLWESVCWLCPPPIPNIMHSDLSLMLHKPLCWFLSNTNLFCLYSVLPQLWPQQKLCFVPSVIPERLHWPSKNKQWLHCSVIMNRFKWSVKRISVCLCWNLSHASPWPFEFV